MLIVAADSESAMVGAGVRAAAGHARSDGAATLGRVGGRVRSGAARAGGALGAAGGAIRGAAGGRRGGGASGSAGPRAVLRAAEAAREARRATRRRRPAEDRLPDLTEPAPRQLNVGRRHGPAARRARPRAPRRVEPSHSQPG